MNQTPWFLIAYTFSVLAIAVFVIRRYAFRYKTIKEDIHAIHTCVDLIDRSLEDDSVTKEEFVALVKRCLEVINDILP
jgi:hypothetical protein